MAIKINQMEETFTLSIPYKGQQHLLEFTFRKLGYTYKIFATVAGHLMQFEPDEEGRFRATLADPMGELHQKSSNPPEDRAFIEAILSVLTDTFK